MSCPEQQRLFEAYFDRASEHFEGMNFSSPEGSCANPERIRALEQAVEDARLALEQHEREHGCAQLRN